MKKSTISNNELRNLLRRYYEGATTREEESLLREAALAESTADAELAGELRVFLSISQQMDDAADDLAAAYSVDFIAEFNSVPDAKRRYLFTWRGWTVAAACVAILILIGVGVSLLPDGEKREPTSVSTSLTAGATDSVVQLNSESSVLVPQLKAETHMAEAGSRTATRAEVATAQSSTRQIGNLESASAMATPEQSLQETRRLLNRDMGGEEYKPLVCLNDCDDVSPRTIVDVAAEGTMRVSQEMDRLYNSAEMSVQRVAYDFQAP